MIIVIDSYFNDLCSTGKYSDSLSEYFDRVIIVEFSIFSNNVIDIPEDDHVFVIGSIQFVSYMTKNYPNVVSFYDEKRFEVSSYITQAGRKKDLFLNCSPLFTTYGLFKLDYGKYFDILSSDTVFVRPNSGKKIFTGLCIELSDIDHEVNGLDRLSSVSDTTMITISKAQDIVGEYRTIIVSDKVVAHSSYIEGGDITTTSIVPPGAIQCAQEYASLGSNEKVDDYLVCDVARLRDGSFKIIELNSISTSDPYSCNLKFYYDAFTHYLEGIS